MKLTLRTPALSAALWCALGLVAAAPARADGQAMPRVLLLPAYRQECASCHMAYPPGLLPAASWQRLLANLPQHFGTDASLHPATLRALSAWIVPNAGTARKLSREPGPPPDDRITRAGWFVREHREVSATTWQRASVRSASNCVACHAQAEQGNFDEHGVRIPR